MGFASVDDMVSELTAGKREYNTWTKISTAGTTLVAGTWYDLSTQAGSPVANTYPGTTLVAQTPTDKFPGVGIWHGGPVMSDTKHIVNLGAWSSIASAVPGIVMLCDLLMYYPSLTNLVTTAQDLINANTFTASSSSGLLLTYTNDFGVATTNPYTSVRFTTTGTLPVGLNTTDTFWLTRQGATSAKVSTTLANAIAGTFIAYDVTGMSGTHTLTVRPSRYADGAGVRMANIMVSSSGSASTGTPVVHASDFLYTNSAPSPASGRVIGAVTNYTAGGAAAAYAGKIAHSGVAAGNFAPFLPLQAGDVGVHSVQRYRLSTAYGGATTSVSALALLRPLITVPIVTVGVAGERNAVFQIPSLPRIYDDACIIPLFYAGGALAASSPIQGFADFAWG
jgi:hypothetical protein